LARNEKVVVTDRFARNLKRTPDSARVLRISIEDFARRGDRLPSAAGHDVVAGEFVQLGEPRLKVKVKFS
jgi:hypothetical protein